MFARYSSMAAGRSGGSTRNVTTAKKGVDLFFLFFFREGCRVPTGEQGKTS